MKAILGRRTKHLEEHIRRRGTRDGYVYHPDLVMDRDTWSMLSGITFSLTLYFFLRTINSVMNYLNFFCHKIKIPDILTCHFCSIAVVFCIYTLFLVIFVSDYGLQYVGFHRLGQKRKCAMEIIGLGFALVSSLVSTLYFEDINCSYALTWFILHVKVLAVLLCNIGDVGYGDILLEATLQIFVVKLPIFRVSQVIECVDKVVILGVLLGYRYVFMFNVMNKTQETVQEEANNDTL